MEMKARQSIAAGRRQVWDALNDPDALKAAIPGCESFESTGENQFTAHVTNRIGPVKASFSFIIELSDLDPPNSYVIHGKGQGGAAGFANGSARVSLESDGDNTILIYELDASVGGKLAQLGGRLIDGAAKKLADEFFSRLGEVIASREDALQEESAELAEAETADEPVPGSRPAASILIRLGAILLLAAILFYWFA